MKRNLIITFLATGTLMGMLLVWQFMTNAPLNSGFITDEIEAKDELIKDFLNDQSYLQSKIVFLRERIEDSQNEIQIYSEENNLAFLNSLKKDIGLTEVRGNGIEILLNDSPLAYRNGEDVSESELVQAADLRDIVNVLNAANANAISVNNQRIIATSAISSVGTTLLVNNSFIAPPFTISAVGDVEMIIQRLRDESTLSSLYDRSLKYNLVFQISVKEWVTVPVYNGDLKALYLNLIN